MAPSSLLVVICLQVLVALSAMLTVIFLVRQHRASDTSLQHTVRTYVAKWSDPLKIIAIAVVLVTVADFLLPPERIHTEVFHLQPVDQGTMRVTYGTCCTGGGVASCDTSGLPAGELRQPILVQRTRILDRCTVEPSPNPPAACKCS